MTSNNVWVAPAGDYSSNYSNPLDGFDDIWNFDYTSVTGITNMESSETSDEEPAKISKR